ncbi:hypothetical protein RHGRI_035582 [Rhododendron griersonianum]|uniref:Beta-glucosidase n=1 Tax=Rhododendron griersonianum TaxID=479676 RepID=A0AAV6HMM3_9ERIC|nr:hypothetical protein RHGRI_035582 [Rhododendron griersonianum]
MTPQLSHTLLVIISCLHTHRLQNCIGNRFVEPLVFGDYPDITKKNAGKRLLAFTKLESDLVKGAIDFIGLNHYNTFSIKDQSSSLKMNHRDFNADMAVELIEFGGSDIAHWVFGWLKMIKVVVHRYTNNVVDLNNLRRYPKLSAYWYSNFLKAKSMSPDGAIEVEKSISCLSQSHFSE